MLFRRPERVSFLMSLLLFSYSSSSSSCNWQSQWVCWQDTLWQPMWLIAAQPAINACFKTVDWRRLNYFARQSVPQIRRSIKEKIFSVLLPWNFFEVFEAVTSHLIIDNLKAIALVNSVNIMHNLVQLNEIAPFSSLN